MMVRLSVHLRLRMDILFSKCCPIPILHALQVDRRVSLDFSVIMFKTLLGESVGVERKVTVGAGLLEQYSQRLNAYMENTQWLEAWKT
jgi:hypothetical protein